MTDKIAACDPGVKPHLSFEVLSIALKIFSDAEQQVR